MAMSMFLKLSLRKWIYGARRHAKDRFARLFRTFEAATAHGVATQCPGNKFALDLRPT